MATTIWTGLSPTTSNWSDPDNWSLLRTPVGGDVLQFAGSTRTTTVNDLPEDTKFTITFNAGASAFTNTGNRIAVNGTITNSSSNLQTIEHDLLLTASRTIVTSTADITISGIISSLRTTYGITVQGSNTTILSGNNTFAGGVTLNNGILKCSLGAFNTVPRTWSINSTLILDGNTTPALGTTIFTGSSGTLRITGGTFSASSSNNVSITTTSTIDIQAGAQLTNTGFTWGTNPPKLLVSGTLDLYDSDINCSEISGSGTIDKTVAGTSNITITNGGAQTFNGTLQNTAGTINVVKNGVGNQILSGAGITYSGTTIVNAGGLTVNKDISTGSTYTVYLDKTGVISLISTTGTVTIGGSLVVSTCSNSTLATVYTIISAGTVSGTFSNYSEGTSFRKYRDLTINYTATTVTLTDITPVGTYYVGNYGTYENWNAVKTAIRNTTLTENKTFIQISDTSEGSAGNWWTFNPGGKSLTLTSEVTHNGDITKGWKSVVSAGSTSSYFIVMNPTASINLEIKNLRIHCSSAIGDLIYFYQGSGTAKVHDLIIDCAGYALNALSSNANGVTLSIYNIIVIKPVTSAYNVLAGTNRASIWNLTTYDGASAIAANCVALRNCASFPASGVCYGSQSGTFSKCASSDTSGSEAGLRSLSAVNCFSDLVNTSNRFLEIKPNGPLWQTGTASLATGQTTDIRARQLPDKRNLYSIGACCAWLDDLFTSMGFDW